MAGLVVPEWIEEVVIAADADKAGCDGAASLMASLVEVGVRCSIEGWGEAGSGFDAADELKRRNGGSH
jgi:hypothetical protein